MTRVEVESRYHAIRIQEVLMEDGAQTLRGHGRARHTVRNARVWYVMTDLERDEVRSLLVEHGLLRGSVLSSEDEG